MRLDLHHIAFAFANHAQQAALLQTPGLREVVPFGQTNPGGLLPQMRHALYAAPNAFIEMHQAGTPSAYRPVNEAGITHICLQSATMEPLHGALVAQGATPHCTPLDLGTGNLYSYLRDTEHNVIEVEALAYAPPAQAPWLAHVGIASHDGARLAAFYQQILGGARSGGYTVGPNPRLDALAALTDVRAIPYWITGGNVSIEIWQFLNPPTLPRSVARTYRDPGYSHICFETDNLQDAMTLLMAAGATVVWQSQDDAAGDVAFMANLMHSSGVEYTPEPVIVTTHNAYLHDPDGNLIELLQLDDDTIYPRIATLPHPTIIAAVAALRSTP